MKIKLDANEVTDIKAHDDEFTAVVLENGAKIYVSVKNNELSIDGEELAVEQCPILTVAKRDIKEFNATLDAL